MMQTLPGFREFYPDDCALRNYIFDRWRQTARNFGFVEYDSPVLEPLELFTEKSGEEIVTQLFNFEDKGGRPVALRPEMTPSLVRMVAAKAGSLKKPIKWFSIGEQYRFERPQKGRLRSFYQLNVDLFGEESAKADAEVIAVLILTLRSFGLTDKDFCVYLGDRDLWFHYIRSWGIPEEHVGKILAVIDKIERDEHNTLIEKLVTYFSDADKAKNFFYTVLELVKIKTWDGLKEFCQNLNTSAYNHEHLVKRLQEWELLWSTLRDMGLESFMQINLGIVRGLAYYTGFVFEAFDCSGESRALAGGGRYDNLVEKLGGPSMPVVGFGMGDVTLRDILQAKKFLLALEMRLDAFIIASGKEELTAAMKDATLLRLEGINLEYSLKEMNFTKQLKLASEKEAKFALIYGSEELAKNMVKIRNMTTRNEIEVPRQELRNSLIELLTLNQSLTLRKL